VTHLGFSFQPKSRCLFSDNVTIHPNYKSTESLKGLINGQGVRQLGIVIVYNEGGHLQYFGGWGGLLHIDSCKVNPLQIVNP